MINLPPNIVCHRKIDIPVTAKIKKGFVDICTIVFSCEELKGFYKCPKEGHLDHSGQQLLIK